MREKGERGDIVRTMQKALRAEGAERDPMSFAIHDAAPATPIVGRVIDKHLSDELGESLTLVVDFSKLRRRRNMKINEDRWRHQCSTVLISSAIG